MRRTRPFLAATLTGALLVALTGCGGGAASVRVGPATPGPAGSPAASSAGTAAPDSAASTCSIPGASGPGPAPADLLHPAGTWFGMAIDWSSDSVATVSARLGAGHTPAAWVNFVTFPIPRADRGNLDAFYAQVRSAGGIAVLTLQPNGGLGTVTPAAAMDLARLLAGYRACGVSTIVRFAHEMNGSWYPWGQDPVAYVAAFRTVAAAVHRAAPGNAMLWAPNSGDGYPFTGGQYGARPGTSAFSALDTDHDGRLTGSDDPYAPYWPGAAAVDWVGMSLYHWGNSYPWGANDVPPAQQFTDLLTGRRGVSAGSSPDFYATWAQGHHKPLAIVETAAFWRPDAGGASELAVKQAWWRQVFSAATAQRFPLIRLIGWFEWRKLETEVHAVVDWRLTAEPGLVEQFLADLPAGRLRFAPTGS